MRTYLLAATAVAAIATPAAADPVDSGYIGLEGGVMFPQSQDIFGSIAFTNTGVTNFTRSQVATLRYKTGWDADIIGGYRFGLFRVEGEFGYKYAKHKNITFSSAFVSALNAGAGTSFTTASTYNLASHTSVWSAMLNGLVDSGANGGFGFYGGGGVGYAGVKQLGSSKGRFAWQLILGAYVPVSDQINVGLKYRYFNAGHTHRVLAFPFTAGTGTCGGGETSCSGGTIFFDDSSRFTSHSLLLSFVYNFAPPAPPPAPPPSPPPPPPPPPATQTCPDGSVIAATSTCPAPPPPPPPPPPPAPERGG